MKNTKLSPAQLRVKKLLKPIVESVLNENYNDDLSEILSGIKQITYRAKQIHTADPDIVIDAKVERTIKTIIKALELAVIHGK